MENNIDYDLEKMINRLSAVKDIEKDIKITESESFKNSKAYNDLLNILLYGDLYMQNIKTSGE